MNTLMLHRQPPHGGRQCAFCTKEQGKRNLMGFTVKLCEINVLGTPKTLCQMCSKGYRRSVLKKKAARDYTISFSSAQQRGLFYLHKLIAGIPD
jgi:hypothetical protein